MPSTAPVSPLPVIGLDVGRRRARRRSGGEDRGGERVLAAGLERGGDTKHARPVAAVGCNDSITAGRLRVSVPVLSSATTRTLPSASRAAPPLTSTPIVAAAPIAATTVTGTEIANAHGAAATSTTERATDPDRRVAEQAADEAIGSRDDHDAGHERPRDPLGETLAVALALLGLLDDVHDPRQRAVRGARR